jgi:hypothetical protein
MGRPVHDLTGMTFVFLMVLERAGSVPSSGSATWRCRCDAPGCGAIKVVQGGALLRGTIKSCGCQRRKLQAESMIGRMTRERNPNWKGGRTITEHGYVLVRVGKEHHLSHVTGYAYEHRVIAEQNLGRRLRDGEEGHHRNRVRHDNSADNIEGLSTEAHHAEHSLNLDRRPATAPNQMISCACGCGERFLKYDKWNRPCKFASQSHVLRVIRPDRERRKAR